MIATPSSFSCFLPIPISPLPGGRPGLALVGVDRMQHDLDGILLCVGLEALGPVVADGVREDGAILVEGGRCDASSDIGVALETVLGILVPKVEGAVRASSAECAVDWVERDVVDSVNVDNVVLRRISVTLEREVQAAKNVSELPPDDRQNEAPRASFKGGQEGSRNAFLVLGRSLTSYPCPRRIE